MKFEIFKFESVTSTNDVAINLIKEKKREIGCVCANKQTKGRGTHGKSWISDEGNLFISIFFQLKDSYPSFNEFSMINPVIISEIIEHFCKKKDVSIKWPNDVFVNRKKICGILQEIITLNGKKFLIIGIGINILTDPNVNTKYQTTNILLEAKKKPQIMEIINLILFSYEKFFSNLNSYDYISFTKKAEQKVVN